MTVQAKPPVKEKRRLVSPMGLFLLAIGVIIAGQFAFYVVAFSLGADVVEAPVDRP